LKLIHLQTFGPVLLAILRAQCN